MCLATLCTRLSSARTRVARRRGLSPELARAHLKRTMSQGAADLELPLFSVFVASWWYVIHLCLSIHVCCCRLGRRPQPRPDGQRGARRGLIQRRNWMGHLGPQQHRPAAQRVSRLPDTWEADRPSRILTVGPTAGLAAGLTVGLIAGDSGPHSRPHSSNGPRSGSGPHIDSGQSGSSRR